MPDPDPLYDAKPTHRVGPAPLECGGGCWVRFDLTLPEGLGREGAYWRLSRKLTALLLEVKRLAEEAIEEASRQAPSEVT